MTGGDLIERLSLASGGRWKLVEQFGGGGTGAWLVTTPAGESRVVKVAEAVSARAGAVVTVALVNGLNAAGYPTPVYDQPILSTEASLSRSRLYNVANRTTRSGQT